MFHIFSRNIHKQELQKTTEAYLSCRFLNYGIAFMHTAIKTCCHSKEGITFYSDYKGEKIDWARVEKQRLDVINNCIQGVLPETCKGCINLAKRNWNNSLLINEIVINNWDQCNCNCIYCVYSSHGTFLQTKK